MWIKISSPNSQSCPSTQLQPQYLLPSSRMPGEANNALSPVSPTSRTTVQEKAAGSFSLLSLRFNFIPFLKEDL